MLAGLVLSISLEYVGAQLIAPSIVAPYIMTIPFLGHMFYNPNC